MVDDIGPLANACLDTLARGGAYRDDHPYVRPEDFQIWLHALRIPHGDRLGVVDVDRIYSIVSAIYFDSARLPRGLWLGSVSALRAAVAAAHPDLRFTFSDFALAMGACKEAHKIVQIGPGSGRFLVIYDTGPIVAEPIVAAAVAEPALHRPVTAVEPDAQPGPPAPTVEDKATSPGRSSLAALIDTATNQLRAAEADADAYGATMVALAEAGRAQGEAAARARAELSATIVALGAAAEALSEENYILKQATWQ